MPDFIDLEIPAAPPSANRIWRTNPNARGNYLSADARAWFNLVAASVYPRKAPDGWPFYKVEIIVEPPRRSGDVDNKIKPILDALTRAGFWPDDDRVAFVSCEFGAVNKSGRTLVKISKLESKYK